MIVTAVTVYVKPAHVDDFIRATAENHEGSVREPGNIRFDVLQCKTDPARFLLYEAYESEDAAAAHKKTAHYLKWRDTVADWMARPREGVPHRVIRPEGRRAWS
jgi:autoinducer 2-degrading protein